MYLPLWMVVVIGMIFAALVALRWELMDLLFDRVRCLPLEVWPQTDVTDAEHSGTDSEPS